jgi:hypothetical protein
MELRTFAAELAAVALLTIPAGASDPCADPPPAADAYLRTQPGWKILRLQDMDPDDQSLWIRYHKNLCPGMAAVDFDGSGKRWVGLALLRHAENGVVEKIAFVRLLEGRLETHLVYRDFPAYQVIWTRPPETVHEFETGKTTAIAHESLVVEHLEASTQQWYRRNGTFHFVQTSD